LLAEEGRRVKWLSEKYFVTTEEREIGFIGSVSS
jgi:hypothetical protein